MKGWFAAIDGVVIQLLNSLGVLAQVLLGFDGQKLVAWCCFLGVVFCFSLSGLSGWFLFFFGVAVFVVFILFVDFLPTFLFGSHCSCLPLPLLSSFHFQKLIKFLFPNKNVKGWKV